MMKFPLLIQLLIICIACSNETRENAPDFPVRDLIFPAPNTYWTNENVAIQGKGFKATDEIWLEKITSDDPDIPGKIQITNIEIFPNSFLFTTPLTATGTFKVILKRHGKEFYLGTIIIKALLKKGKNLYAYRSSSIQGSADALIKIDKNTGRQEVIAPIPDMGVPNYRSRLFFIHNTQEIVYIQTSLTTAPFEISTKLIKIQVHTGIVNTIDLQAFRYASVFLDDSENLYAIVFNSSYQKQLIKIDPANGEHQVITSIDNNNVPQGYTVCKASTKEIISITKDESDFQFYLEKTNIQTGKTEMIPFNENYEGLWIDRYENLYAKIYPISNNTQLREIDDSGNVKKIIFDIDIPGNFISDIDYNPSTNEFIALYSIPNQEGDHIWRIDVSTKETISLLTLESPQDNPSIPRYSDYLWIVCD